MDVQLLGADDDSYSDRGAWTLTASGGDDVPATRLGRAALWCSRWLHRTGDALSRWAWRRDLARTLRGRR